MLLTAVCLNQVKSSLKKENKLITSISSSKATVTYGTPIPLQMTKVTTNMVLKLTYQLEVGLGITRSLWEFNLLGV